MSDQFRTYPNVNCLWGAVMAATLARLGLRQAVISPGSRSGPLTIGFAGEPSISVLPLIDERSAAFFALGLAKRTQRATALICTSGTAPAHYFPAVIEARESRTPLLILAADRPPELRHCQAGQAIDQSKLFGHYPVFQAEAALPENREDRLRWLRQFLAQAWDRAHGPVAGPVFLNLPFRDPLDPTPQGEPCRWEEESFFADFRRARSALPDNAATYNASTPAPAVLPNGGYSARGLIVAGPALPADPEGWAAQAGRMAQQLGWPVLADAASGLRGYEDRIPNLVSAYHFILRHPSLAESLRPAAVLHFGPVPSSKVLREWLGKCPGPVWMAESGPEYSDPLHRAAAPWPGLGPTTGLVDSQRSESESYAAAWREAEDQASRYLNQWFEARQDWFEGKAAWLLGRRLPPGTSLFLASSMPIRDAELFLPTGRHRLRAFGNRGANGIDGALSTALGFAHDGPPAAALLGDLSFLHDTNGLMAARELRGSLKAVVIDNRGGGIFEHLPIAGFDPPFERYFATPPSVDLELLCRAHGVPCRSPGTWAEFAGWLSAPPVPGLEVILLRTDRKIDAATRRTLFATARTFEWLPKDRSWR